MISFKCKTCGGEISINRQGEMICDFCGSKAIINDKDYEQYHDFRLRVLQFIRSSNDEAVSDSAKRDAIWSRAEEKNLTMDNGTNITLRYIYTASNDIGEMYLTQKAVIYVINKKASDNVQFLKYFLSHIEFPSADMRGLDKCFPSLNAEYKLNDGSILVALSRPEDYYPLTMFGKLSPESVAWVISRLENIACVLEYSDIVHGHIDADSVLINPFTHQAMLTGGWWAASTKHSSNNPYMDLLDIRKTAKHSLGYDCKDLNKEFDQFLKEVPSHDAYTDFERWDQVIEKGFGGRRFVKMDVNF